MVTVTNLITSDMLVPIFDALKANISIVLPIGMSIFGAMVSIRLVPKLFRMFF